ncbi:hypothetical protein D3C84_934350 [compost metagenome]
MHLRTGRTGLGARSDIGRPQIGFGVTFSQVFSNRQGVGNDAVLTLEQWHLGCRRELQQPRAGVRLVEFDQGFFVASTGQFKGQRGAQRPGRIQLVADDQVVTHGSAPEFEKRKVLWTLSLARPAPTGRCVPLVEAGLAGNQPHGGWKYIKYGTQR